MEVMRSSASLADRALRAVMTKAPVRCSAVFQGFHTCQRAQIAVNT